MDYSGRQKQFQQSLIDEELDGFVVMHAANLRYLCGYTGSNWLLLFLAGRRVFFTDGRYTQQAREEVVGARVVISAGPLMLEAAKLIAKLSSAATGFEPDQTTGRPRRDEATCAPPDQWKRLQFDHAQRMTRTRRRTR
jgi:Xaa-Pro aminopeptidase